jgi:hypothetical protein
VIDPETLLTGLGGAAQLHDAAELAKRWLDGNVLDRVLDQVDASFGETTALSAAQLGTWKEDAGFCSALFAASYTGDWDRWRGEVRDQVLRLISASAAVPDQAETELAEEVVAEIEDALEQAQHGDDLTRYMGRRTIIAAERSSVRFLRPDFAPERAKDLLEELVDRFPEEAAALEDALRDRDPETEIAAQVRSPQRFLKDGSGLLWEVLAASAEGVGLWAAALTAWEEAFERPGSERARALVRATTAAFIAGERERAEELFAEAEELDAEHPVVLFAKALRVEGPEEALAILESLEPRKESHGAMREARKAVPLAELGRFEEAEAALKAAVEGDVAELELRERRADVAVQSSKPSWLRGRRNDVKALEDAAEVYLELRDKHRELHAHEGAVAYLSHAVDALLYSGQLRRAIELMSPDALSDEELATPNARTMLAEQLTKAGDPGTALALLEPIEDPGDEVLLVRAIARSRLVEDLDEEELEQTLELLDRLLSEGPHRHPAAQARMIFALRGAPWSDEAGVIVAEHDPGMAVLFRARFLANAQQWDEAERVLQPNMDEPRVQQALLEFAIEQEDRERILARAHEVLAGDPDHAVHLEAARALAEAEASEDAEKALAALSSDQDAPTGIRLAGLPHLAELLNQDHRHRELLTLTDLWLELDPESENAIWGRAHSLFRLGRYEESLELLTGQEQKASTADRRQLLARNYSAVLGGATAAAKIAELADELAEPDEALEALAIFSLLEAEEEPEDALVERVNPARFIELFPDSELIRSIEAPKSPEELIDLLEGLGARDRSERVSTASRLVFEDPEAPLGLIAMAAGRPVAEVWRQMPRRPTNFGLEQIDRDERANAAKALALGAVWDSSSVLISEQLGHRADFRGALPKSVIAQSVLDDVLEASRPVRGGGQMSVALEPNDQVRAEELNPADLEADAELAKRMFDAAVGLTVEADHLAGDEEFPGQGSDRDGRELAPQMLGFLATLAIARRLGLAVYSDDRVVRLRARQMGLRTFGTLALLDALSDRGDISAEQRLNARRGLRELGATGTWPSAEELAEDARRASFRLTQSLALTLRDVSPLRVHEERWILTGLGFLRTVHDEVPETLEVWVARWIDLLCEGTERMGPAQHGSRLLALAWNPNGPEPGFVRALADAVQSTARRFGDKRSDPIVAAARLLRDATWSYTDLGMRIQLIGSFADCLSPGDSFRARLVAVEKNLAPPHLPE